jgi:CBS domain-containing protein
MSERWRSARKLYRTLHVVKHDFQRIGIVFAPLAVATLSGGEMKINDIMTANPMCVTSDATIREAAQVMKREDVGIVPVIENQGDRRLIGVVTDRDIAIRCVAEGKDSNCRVRDAMSHDLATCTPNDDVGDAMQTMGREKVRRIPIVDERGSLVGIVSQADLLRRGRDDSAAAQTVERISEPGGRHNQ